MVYQPAGGGVSWCGSRSGPSAGRAGRVDTVGLDTLTTAAAAIVRSGLGRQVRRHGGGAEEPLGRRATVVTVNGGNRPQIVILGGRQHIRDDRSPRWPSLTVGR